MSDGDVLRAARPGSKEVRIPLAVRVGGPRDRFGVLSVNDHEGAVRAQDRQVFLELVLVEEREFVNSGVQQEALEPEDTGIVQPTEVFEVAGDGPTPETHVDVALPKCGVTFDLESLDGA